MIYFDDKYLTVKEIGLRATRLTNYYTGHSVFIPNSKFTNGVITNVSDEPGYWALPNIRLAADTSAAQMEAVIEGARAFLASHPDVDWSDLRFDALGDAALELLLVYHIREFGARYRVLTEVNLAIKRFLEEHEVRLAVPKWKQWVESIQSWVNAEFRLFPLILPRTGDYPPPRQCLLSIPKSTKLYQDNPVAGAVRRPE